MATSPGPTDTGYLFDDFLRLVGALAPLLPARNGSEQSPLAQALREGDRSLAEIVSQGNRHSDEHIAAQLALGDMKQEMIGACP